MKTTVWYLLVICLIKVKEMVNYIFATWSTYMMRVTGTYNEPLDRQIMERVQISNFQGPVLINRRNEMGGIRIDKMRYRRWGGD